MNFRDNALKNRYRLLVSLSYLRRHDQGQGQSDLAKELTALAIEQGYTQPRKAPPGNMINTWIKKREAPAWAVKAAGQLLLKTPNYQPQSNDEAEAFSLVLAETLPADSLETFIQLIPDTLKVTLEGTLTNAFEVKKV